MAQALSKSTGEKGLVYSTYSYHACYEDLGTVTVYAGMSPGNAEQVIELIEAECRGGHSGTKA